MVQHNEPLYTTWMVVGNELKKTKRGRLQNCASRTTDVMTLIGAGSRAGQTVCPAAAVASNMHIVDHLAIS